MYKRNTSKSKFHVYKERKKMELSNFIFLLMNTSHLSVSNQAATETFIHAMFAPSIDFCNFLLQPSSWGCTEVVTHSKFSRCFQPGSVFLSLFWLPLVALHVKRDYSSDFNFSMLCQCQPCEFYLWAQLAVLVVLRSSVPHKLALASTIAPSQLSSPH